MLRFYLIVFTIGLASSFVVGIGNCDAANQFGFGAAPTVSLLHGGAHSRGKRQQFLEKNVTVTYDLRQVDGAESLPTQHFSKFGCCTEWYSQEDADNDLVVH